MYSQIFCSDGGKEATLRSHMGRWELINDLFPGHSSALITAEAGKMEAAAAAAGTGICLE